jgi:hypothetical protein
MPGDFETWNELSGDPNQFLRETYDLLSRRSITLYHTYSPITSAIDKTADYAVGDGLFFRSEPDWAELGKTRDYWRDWARECNRVFQPFRGENRRSRIWRRRCKILC